jgi:hypothetical protein
MRTKNLESWLVGVRLSHLGHFSAAAHNSRMHRALGIPVVIVTTAVGTTVFSTMGQSPHIALTVVTGLLSLTAAILSSLQTFLSYSANAERHKFAAIKYGMLRRELEQFLDDPDESANILREFSQNFRVRWDAVDQESPPIPEQIHQNALAKLRRSFDDERTRDAVTLKAAAA